MKKVLLVVALVAASVALAQPASANQGNGQDKATKAATSTANPNSNLTTTEVPATADTVKAPAAGAVVAAAPKKVVVCKYVTTPDGALDHIVIVSSNALDGNGFNGTFPFTFDDKHVSVAIRYAKAGEQAHDVSPSECVSGTPTTNTPKTPSGNPVLPDTGGSQLPLLLLALSMIASGSTILVRTSSGRFGLVRGSAGSFKD